MKLRRREAVGLQLLTALGAAALLFPFLWMISASLQTLQEVESFPPIWIPAEPQWNNYVDAVLNYNIGRALINSAVITTVSVVGQLIVCSLGAYAFSRLRFPGRDAIFMLFLATMMIPHYVTIIPLYTMVWSAGLIDTYTALIFPGLFSPFGTFLLRQFFNQIPISLDEATLIDGGKSLAYLPARYPAALPGRPGGPGHFQLSRYLEYPVLAGAGDQLEGVVHFAFSLGDGAGPVRDVDPYPDGRLGNCVCTGRRGLPDAAEAVHLQHRFERHEAVGL